MIRKFQSLRHLFSVLLLLLINHQNGVLENLFSVIQLKTDQSGEGRFDEVLTKWHIRSY